MFRLWKIFFSILHHRSVKNLCFDVVQSLDLSTPRNEFSEKTFEAFDVKS